MEGLIPYTSIISFMPFNSMQDSQERNQNTEIIDYCKSTSQTHDNMMVVNTSFKK